jgi:hypothetical protein
MPVVAGDNSASSATVVADVVVVNDAVDVGVSASVIIAAVAPIARHALPIHVYCGLETVSSIFKPLD